MMDVGPAGSPQVFVVDSHAPVNLMPSGVKHTSSKNRVNLLYLLVSLALLGVFIEAVFIFHLYSRTAKQASNSPQNAPNTAPGDPQNAKIIGTNANWHPDGSNEIGPPKEKYENKPAAFLQGLNAREDGVMQWRWGGFGTFIRELEYKEGSLQIQTGGFYYIYSKVFFSETCTLFKHQVMRRSPRYNNAPTELMQSLRYSCVEAQKRDQHRADMGNSFLGGVFELYKGDSVFVQVNDSLLVRTGNYDNFFGAFMI